jgi:hypothetical protein
LLTDPFDQRVDQERQDVDQYQRFDALFGLQEYRANPKAVFQRPETALDLVTGLVEFQQLIGIVICFSKIG